VPAATAGGDSRAALLAFGLFAAYTLLIQPLGYLAATTLFFGAYLRIFGRFRWITVVPAALGVAAGTTYLWYHLAMDLPQGLIRWP
jgi:hypothetical protein